MILQRLRPSTALALAFALTMCIGMYATTAQAQSWVLGHEVTDTTASGGTKVAMDEDTGATAVVGVPLRAPQGAAFVYTLAGMGQWALEATLLPDDPNAGRFGQKVRVSGNTVVVGAPNTTGAFANQGAVYVFKRIGTTWSLAQKLTASDGAMNDTFGQALAYNGSALVVGAPGKDSNRGAAYVFSPSGGTFVEQDKVTGSGINGARFGASVAVSGDTVVAGENKEAFLPSLAAPGAAYVFVRSGSTWPLQQQLAASDGTNANHFGRNVSIDGDTALVTASGDTSSRGAAYIYERQGTTWTERQKLVASDGAAGDLLGFGASIHRGILVLGAPGVGGNQGAGYVFMSSGGVWTERQKLVAPDTASGSPDAGAPTGTQMGQGGGEGCAGTTIMLGTSGPNAAGQQAAYFFSSTTPAGSNVLVVGTPGPTGTTSSVRFNQVTESGHSDLDFDSQCRRLPPGLLTPGASSRNCLSITTTATYSGSVHVCVPLPSLGGTGGSTGGTGGSTGGSGGSTGGTAGTGGTGGGAGETNAVIQCDPNPQQLPCPISGIDPRLVLSKTDENGAAWCCGDITGGGAITDPMCFDTAGLSLFGLGRAAAAAPVPALNGAAVWLAAALVAVAVGLLLRGAKA